MLRCGSFLASCDRPRHLQCLTQTSTLLTVTILSGNLETITAGLPTAETRRVVTVHAADSTGERKRILDRGPFSSASQDYPLSLLPPHLGNFFSFTSSAQFPHLSSTQPWMARGVLIFQQSACPSHLTLVLNTLGCHGKFRTFERHQGRKKVSKG